MKSFFMNKSADGGRRAFRAVGLIAIVAVCIALMAVLTSCNEEEVCTNHTYGEWTVKREASCTIPGLKTRTCTTCTQTESENIPMKGHTEQTVNAVPASCSAEGHTAYIKCADCGTFITYPNTISRTEHIPVTVVVVEPTCQSEGRKNTYCGECGQTLTTGEGIPTTAHTPTIWAGEEATCTKDGYTDGSRCAVCNTVLKDRVRIPALEHNAVTDSGYAASCERDGLTDGSHCDVCKEIIVEQQVIPATGHTRVTISGTAATCTKEGVSDAVVCSGCGTTLVASVTLEKTAHTEVYDSGYAATCTQNGMTDGKHCSACGVVTVAQEIIVAKGHEFTQRTGYAPTCTTEGKSDYIKCKYCTTYQVEPQTIPATGHLHVLTETVAAACERTGYYLYLCSTCGNRKTETIPATGHTVVIDAARPATTTETGLSEGSHCGVCQFVIVKQTTVPRLVEYIVTVENASMGSVNTVGSVMAPGEKITLIATPSEGYGFLGWYYQDGQCASTDATVIFEAFDPDKAFAQFNSVEARFYPMIQLDIVPNQSGIIINGAGYYDTGDVAELSVELTAHYRIEGWYVDGVRISTSDTCQVRVGESAMNIEVKFYVAYHLELQYDDTYGKVEFTTSNIAEDGFVFEGERVRVQVTPDAAYHFLGFYHGDTLLSSQTTYTFTMPSADYRIEAKFEERTFVLHSLSITGGANPTGSGSYTAGTEVTVSASHINGWRFVGWLDAETQTVLSDALSYTFEMPATNLTLYAVYEEELYRLNIITNYKEITIPSPDRDFRYGNTYTLSAPNLTDYYFVGWYVNGEFLGQNHTYTVTFTSDIRAEARYAKYYGVSATVSHNGVAEMNAPVRAYAGEEVFFEIQNYDTGYRFLGWYIGDTQFTNELSFSAQMPEGDVAIEARFAKLYHITVVESKPDAASYRAPETAIAGEMVTVKVTSVKSGYEFRGWHIDATHNTSSREYTFTMPEGDVLIELELIKKVKYTLTSNYEGYSVSYHLPTYEGDSAWIELSMRLDESLRFDGYYINGVCVEAGTRYEFVAGDEDVEIVLMFTEFFYVRVWSETEPFGAYAESEWNTAGSTVRLYADDPGEDYVFRGWYTGNMECISTELEYTFEMPRETIYIYALYARVYTASVSTNAPSPTLIPGDYRVPSGDGLTLTVEEILEGGGYYFDGWYLDGEFVSTATTYTFFLPPYDVSIEARYIRRYTVTVEHPLSVNIAGMGYYMPGETVFLTVSDAGETFYGWYNGDELISKDATITFTMPEQDVALRAVYMDRWDGSIANAFAGGDGTVGSPYLIATGAQLARLASLINDTTDNAYYNKYYRLISDIDLASINWTPIGTMLDSSGNAQTTRAFQGNFDGNGYTIYNMSISSVKGPQYRYIGLFGCAYYATIYDLNLVGAKITSSNTNDTLNLGALAGRADYSSILRCSVDCTISCTYSIQKDMYVGGIVGRSYTATISDCVVSGTVSMINKEYYNIYLGGVVGYADDVDVIRCVSSTICYAQTRKTPCAGGLVGYMQNGSKIQNCLSIGSGESYSSGNYEPYASKICAYIKDSASTYTNCHTSVTYTEAFFTSTLGFSAAVWDFSHVSEGKLPTLIQN